MSILKHRHSAMLENHPPAVEDRRFPTSVDMRPPPLQVLQTNAPPMDNTDEIAFSPHEIDHNLLLFTNTVFYDTNLGRYLDRYEDFHGYENEGYGTGGNVGPSHVDGELSSIFLCSFSSSNFLWWYLSPALPPMDFCIFGVAAGAA